MRSQAIPKIICVAALSVCCANAESRVSISEGFTTNSHLDIAASGGIYQNPNFSVTICCLDCTFNNKTCNPNTGVSFGTNQIGAPSPLIPLIQFALPSIDANSVMSATLILNANNAPATFDPNLVGETFNLKHISSNNNWNKNATSSYRDGSGLIWNNPMFDYTTATFSINSNTTSSYSMDVTADVLGWLNGNYNNNGWGIQRTGGSYSHTYSNPNGTYQLVISTTGLCTAGQCGPYKIPGEELTVVCGNNPTGSYNDYPGGVCNTGYCIPGDWCHYEIGRNCSDGSFRNNMGCFDDNSPPSPLGPGGGFCTCSP